MSKTTKKKQENVQIISAKEIKSEVIKFLNQKKEKVINKVSKRLYDNFGK